MQLTSRPYPIVREGSRVPVSGGSFLLLSAPLCDRVSGSQDGLFFSRRQDCLNPPMFLFQTAADLDVVRQRFYHLKSEVNRDEEICYGKEV